MEIGKMDDFSLSDLAYPVSGGFSRRERTEKHRSCEAGSVAEAGGKTGHA